MSQHLRDVLASQGMGQPDIARVLHLSQASVSRRMTGHTSWRIDEITTVAALLKVTEAELLDLFTTP